MRILVVCGAGASSTFVAQRLRRAASAVGLEWSTSAGTEQTIAGHDADLILIGPHLAARHAAIRELAGAPVIALPDDAFSDLDGSRTLELVRRALTDADNASKGTS